MLHDLAPAAKGRQRHAAPNDLAHDRDVGCKPRNVLGIEALRPTQRHAKAGHDLVVDQQRAVFGAQLAAAAGELDAGAHEVHVAGNGLHHQAGNFATVQGEGLFQLDDVVVLQHQGVLHHLGRHARAGGVAKGSQARAGLDQQRVGMAVVATFKFEDLAAPGGPARQPNGTHAGFGARADQPHHVHGRHPLNDGFGQLYLALGGGAKGKTIERGLLHGLQHGGMAVAQNHRPP